MHDPSLPSITSCPYLPGQPVNILSVPTQRNMPRKRHVSLGKLTEPVQTLRPEDKYLKPKAFIETNEVTRLQTAPATYNPHSDLSTLPQRRSRWSAKSLLRLGRHIPQGDLSNAITLLSVESDSLVSPIESFSPASASSAATTADDSPRPQSRHGGPLSPGILLSKSLPSLPTPRSERSTALSSPCASPTRRQRIQSYIRRALDDNTVKLRQPPVMLGLQSQTPGSTIQAHVDHRQDPPNNADVDVEVQPHRDELSNFSVHSNTQNIHPATAQGKLQVNECAMDQVPESHDPAPPDSTFATNRQHCTIADTVTKQNESEEYVLGGDLDYLHRLIA
jgi:hypothetical protein